MQEERAATSDFKLIGGWLCLDFTNTVGFRGTNHPHETLDSYPKLILWSQQAGILPQNEAEQLLRKAKLHPEEARGVLKRAVKLREAIYRIFTAIADLQSPNAEDLDTLNTEVSEALIHLRITPEKGDFAWIFDARNSDLGRMLWSVSRSAADLLTSKEKSRVKRCASEKCAWLFLDMSRNRTRRWCDMKDCGNLAKARRYYKRKHAFTEVHYP
jgi:predicted RNA-binding Zn ribbon-like protein